MVLTCDIPMAALKRKRMMAEAEQMMEERIKFEAEAAAKKAENQRKVESAMKAVQRTGYQLPEAMQEEMKMKEKGTRSYVIGGTKKEDSDSDEWFSSEETSDEEGLNLTLARTDSVCSFANFLDATLSFLTPKSRTRKEFVARENYLLASAQHSEAAYDTAVERVRAMRKLNVKFADEDEKIEILIPEDERTPEEKELDEIEEVLPGSKADFWWHTVLYKNRFLRNIPGTPSSVGLKTPKTLSQTPQNAGLKTPKTPVRDWKF